MSTGQVYVEPPPPLRYSCVLDVPLELRGAPVRIVGKDGLESQLYRAYGEPDFNHQPLGVPSIMIVKERDWWRYVLLREFPQWWWWPATHVFTTG